MDLKELAGQIADWSQTPDDKQVLIQRSPEDQHQKALDRERLKRKKVNYLRHESVQERISKLTEELEEYEGELTEPVEEVVVKKLYDASLLAQESDDLISYL